jgi:heme O synthase-like polyprenyltransferase
MLNNVAKPDSLQMALWQHVACWISKDTCTQAYASAQAPTLSHTHAHARTRTRRGICNTYCFFMVTQMYCNVMLFVLAFLAFVIVSFKLLYCSSNLLSTPSLSTVRQKQRIFKWSGVLSYFTGTTNTLVLPFSCFAR